MDLTEIIGIGSGICTGISMLPQLIKIIREKKAGDISGVMVAVLMLGLAGWIWYGARKNDAPILVTNIFGFLVNVGISIASFRYRHDSNSSAAEQK